MNVTSSFKRAAAWGLVHSGALSLHRSLTRRKKAILLMYHRVNDRRDPFFPALPVKTFSAQLEYLASRYRVEPLESVLEWLHEGGSGPPRVAITVDDGYPDTHSSVLPELERLGIPATVFLATSPPETGRALWTDRTRHMVKQATSKRLSLPSLGLENTPLETDADKLTLIKRLLRGMKRFGPVKIGETLLRLTRDLKPRGPEPDVLTWSQVRRMVQGPVFLGAHTHNHYMVSRLDSEEIVAEVETSMRLIRERAGVVATSFAYPNGEPDDYDRRSIEVLRRLGLTSAVTTVNGFARPHQDPYELPRLYTTEPFIPLFAARLEGFSRDVS